MVEFGPEYVTDVQWSPQKPSVFSTVDMAGRIHLWDLNEDVELPAELVPEKAASSAASAAPPTAFSPLNRLRWHSAGLHVAAADSAGKIYLCNVHEVLNLSTSLET